MPLRCSFDDPATTDSYTLSLHDALPIYFVPDVVVHDGDWVEGGTGGGRWRFEAVHTPGHTSNHLCFALPDAGILFSGDHVMRSEERRVGKECRSRWSPYH